MYLKHIGLAATAAFFILVGPQVTLAGVPEDSKVLIAASDDVKSKAVAAINSKDFDRAIAILEKAASDDPFDEELNKLLGIAYNNRGWSKTEKDDIAGAFDDFRRSNAVEPKKEAATYLGLGYTSFRLKQQDDALSYLNEAAYLNPTDGQAHVLMGQIYYQDGKLHDAVREWELAEQLTPGDANIKELLAKAKKELGVEGGFTRRETYYFNIKYEGGEERRLGDQVLDILNKAYTDIGGDLDYYPRQPVTVILYTRKQFSDITEAPSWSGGVFDGSIRIPIGGQDIDRTVLGAVLYHEYTHAVIRMVAGNNVPTWLNEGIAQYEERWVRTPSAELGEQGTVPLSSLNGSFLKIGDPGSVRQAYAESLSAVGFYVDRFGRYSLAKLVRLLGDGKDVQSAVQDTTGVSFKDFEGYWLNSLNKQ